MKELPFQLKTVYNDVDGFKALRVLTKTKKLTKDRAQAEKSKSHRAVSKTDWYCPSCSFILYIQSTFFRNWSQGPGCSLYSNWIEFATKEQELQSLVKHEKLHQRHVRTEWTRFLIQSLIVSRFELHFLFFALYFTDKPNRMTSSHQQNSRE